MYGFLILFLVFLLLFGVILRWRSRHAGRKACCLPCCEKKLLLNELLKPFGYRYLEQEDVVSSRWDAWQKVFGYCFLYDKSAPKFNMIFDCEPVYFDFEGKTWLIEFWKGQYGINIGGEIGIYRAGSLIKPEDYENTVFYGVSEDLMLPVSFTLNYKGQTLFSVCGLHWWQTGFRMGRFCNPEDLCMEASITFSCEEMRRSFVDSLLRLGYSECDIHFCGLTVSFAFSIPHTRQPRHFRRITGAVSQFCNRLLCRLFVWITQPFDCTVDRLLYLYYFLPIAFRRCFRFKRNRKQKLRRRAMP